MKPHLPGLFFVGTDTGVGKTRVAALAACWLRERGRSVGVYKPAASGCRRRGTALFSEDADQLWQAAGRPGTLDLVCPQRFAAPLAPPRAAAAAGQQVDAARLRSGLAAWYGQADVLVVEGAGGLFSPISETDLVAHLAAEFGLPVVLVARNQLGTIHQTLAAVLAARGWAGGLPLAGIVLCDVADPQADPSTATNADDLRKWCPLPLLARLAWTGQEFLPQVDWWAVANGHPPGSRGG